MFRSASSVRQPRLPRAPVRSLADAAHRLLCAQRVLRRWAEDRTLEHQEFKAMWTPFRGIMTHVFILVCFNLLSMCRIDLFIFYTRDALDDFYLNNHFPEGPVNQMIVFSEVDTVERLWSFVDYLVDSTGEEDPPSVTMHNPLLGNIRLRQVRVRGEPCVVAQWPELDEDYDKCFRFLSSENEDREPFGLGEAGGEAWVYREDEEGDPAYGYLSMYPPGGYWTHLPRDDEEAQELVDTLKNNSWVDAATRAVFVDLVTYNANLNYLSLTVVFFELPPGGGVVSRLVTRTAPLMQYATQFDAWRLGHELVFLVCSAVLTVGALLRALRHLWDSCRLYVFDMPSTWTLMNLLMLGCCWAAIWFGLNRYAEATRVLLAMQAEGLAASQRVERFFYYEYGGVRLVACVVFMMWLRTFQYHRVTTQVLETLQRSRFDLVSYFFMYVVLHCAFAQAGYYLFGDQSSAFKTFSESLLAVLAIALGEMGSDVFIRAHWVVGPLFFILLIFVIIFVFHNMFFVILSYNYDSVREERSQLDRGLNFMSFMKNGFRNFCKMRGLRLPPHDPLVDMERRLMRCGFSPGSLQAFRAFLKPRQQQQEAKGRGVGLELQPNMASLADLNAVEDEIALMERELLQAKSEISSLVSSLSGDFAGMES